MRTFEDRKAPKDEEEDHEIMVAQVRRSREMLSALVREREVKVAETLTRLEAGCGFPAPASVPETVPASEGNEEVRSSGPADLPALVPDAADQETAEPQAPQPVPAPPCPDSAPPCGGEPARAVATVFVGGPRNGHPGRFDEADESTHVQSGYQLRTIVLNYRGKPLQLRIFGEPSANEQFLSLHATNMLATRYAPVIEGTMEAQAKLAPTRS